ncbi:MAG: phosphatase RsbU N-terminal domain-containing protein [Gammaproteobacteria bacterium]|nr:phosphatase RsbU N-terminal domain-containing protein [Gammaproteobacteria bacterium]
MMVAQTEVPRHKMYQQILSSYLDNGGENALAVAYEFGRKELQDGIGLLEVAEAHQQALEMALSSAGDCPVIQSELNEAASRFFKETLSPFEISRLCHRHSNEALIKLYDVFESEAKRIAHRLHDESAQILAVVYLELAEIAKHSTHDTAIRIGTVVGHLDEVTSQLRSLSHELRPIILDQLGLMPAIRALVDGVRKRSSLAINISGDTRDRINPEIETVIYRTVQEALTNVSRHANARHCDIQIWREEDYIFCTVSDDGSGFQSKPNVAGSSHGLGLIGIKERVGALGGTFQISSQSNVGTTLQVEIPL